MRHAGSSISIPTKLLATGVACAAALVVCGTAATVVVAADVTNRLGNSKRAALLASAFRANSVPGKGFRDVGATARTLDSLVAPLGPAAPVSPRSLRLLQALNGAPIPANAAAAESALPAPIPDPAKRRPKLPLSLDSLRQVDLTPYRTDAQDPWLPLFREWARGERQPSLWRWPHGTPDARLVTPRASIPWGVLFAENEFASLLAFHDGQRATALERARENVAGARNFVEQPVVIDAVLGRIYLRRSLQVLAFVASAANDSTAVRQALQVDSAAKNYFGTFNRTLLVEGESNARSHVTEAFAANTAFHPSLRIESLSTIALGGCRNLPELVFGFSEKRRDAMTRAVASVRDIEGGAELAARQQQFLESMFALNTPPASDSRGTILDRSALLSAFSWIVPPGVRARAALCMEQGR